MRVKMATESWFHAPGWGASEDRGRLDLDADFHFVGRRHTLRFQRILRVALHRQRLNPRFVAVASAPSIMGFQFGLWLWGIYFGFLWSVGTIALFCVIVWLMAKTTARTDLWVRVDGVTDCGHEIGASFLVVGSRRYSELWTKSLARTLGGYAA